MRPTGPNQGLVAAFNDLLIPRLPAVDLGCGAGENAILMAQSGFRATGYDLDSQLLTLAQQAAQKFGLTNVAWDNFDVLNLAFPTDSFSVVGVGMTIYNPKSAVEGLLQRTFGWLASGGVLHVEFATYNDASLNSELIQSGCYLEAKGSYVFSCGGLCSFCHMLMEGVNGGSFWDPQEAKALIASLGPTVPVHEELVEFEQQIGDLAGEDGGTQHRSFYQLTVQKQ